MRVEDEEKDSRELGQAGARLRQQRAEERAAAEGRGRRRSRDSPPQEADGEDEGVLAEPRVGAAGGGAGVFFSRLWEERGVSRVGEKKKRRRGKGGK